jgi:hypothetical protein
MTAAPNPAPVLRTINSVGNMLGATIAFLYFRVIDPSYSAGMRLGWIEITYSALIVAVLIGTGHVYTARWLRPLARAGVGDPTLTAADMPLVRRRALLFPYLLAGVSLFGWTMAGLIWGIALPLAMHHFSWMDVLRQLFGVTVIAGGVTCAFIFFASEYAWRRRLPFFFPAGDLRAVPRVPRLAVRARLLAIFLLTGVVPLSVLGILAYMRALDLVGADPATAAEIVADLQLSIAFLLAVGVLAAIGLALFAANSVAAPLKDVETAMAEV